MFNRPRCSISFNDMFTRFATEQFLKLSLQTSDIIFAFCAFSLLITLSIIIVILKIDIKSFETKLQTLEEKPQDVKIKIVRFKIAKTIKKTTPQQPLRRSARIQAQTLRRSARIQAQKLISL